MGPRIGCQTVAPMPAEDTAALFQEATDLKADYLVAPYHSCYRQHCKMQLKYGSKSSTTCSSGLSPLESSTRRNSKS